MFMDDGVVPEHGASGEIFNYPRHIRLAEFLSKVL
jgi:ABC-type histidine transport system ATPase subunit